MSNSFLDAFLSLESLRGPTDAFDGESKTHICLEVVLNQRVGVERATAAVRAILFRFGRPALPALVSSAPVWSSVRINRSAGRCLQRLVRSYFETRPEAQRGAIDQLPSSIVGALSSLERYYNRDNRIFDALRAVELPVEELRSLTPTQFPEITGLTFDARVLPEQLATAARLRELSLVAKPPSREDLLALRRVGEETADTLLLYLFDQPALIIDEYLKRILHRHGVIEKPTPKRVVAALGSRVQDTTVAKQVHGRALDLGVLHCVAGTPNCGNCPLGRFAPVGTREPTTAHAENA